MIGKHSNIDFLQIFEDTLDELRHNGRVFAKQNPELASYLDLSYRKSNDPETERLIESVAYMAAQVEYKAHLSQNDYANNFIEHMFPEFVMPLPAMTIVKVELNKKNFESQQNFLLPKNTLFSVDNDFGVECLFSTLQEYSLIPFKIVESRFVDSNISTENIFNESKAFVLEFETDKAISVGTELTFPVFIDAEISTTLSIFDMFFSCQKNIKICYNDLDNCFNISRENLILKNKFSENNFGHESNNLYPFFEFLNYHQKFLFFKIKLKSHIDQVNKFKIIIPVDAECFSLSKYEKFFFHLNCIPVFNVFEKRLTPIKCNQEKFEYPLQVEKSFANLYELLSVSKIVTYDSSTGGALEIPCFHKGVQESLFGVSHFHDRFSWSTRRSFFSTTAQNGELFLHINGLSEYDKEDCPEYLFPSGFCTNGLHAENVRASALFFCMDSRFSFKKVTSLMWPKYSKRILNSSKSLDILKFFYKINQELLTTKSFKLNDLKKIIEYSASEQSPLKGILSQVLAEVIKMSVQETLTQKIWNNQSYHVPGVVYHFEFSKARGYPVGTHFFISFLNFYFDYIRQFNFRTSFKVTLI